jgi:colicin import membrane protein
MNEVVKVNPSEYGIEEKKANELIGNLPQLQSERDVLENQYNEVIKMDIESVETSKIARELRLKIRDNRTKGIAIWHKTTKEVFLRAGQYVDAVKNREVAINERMEENLEEIEKHFEIQEQKRRDALRESRVSELSIYSEFVPFGIDLGAMNDEEYQKVFNGAKLQFDAKIEAEKKAEQERIELERIEAERIEAQRVENERLKKEAEQRELELKAEREKAEAERKRLAEIQAKKDAEQAEKLRLERQEKEKAERELQEEKERQAQLEKQRLDAELQAKKEAEKLAKAPIKKQLTFWVDAFSITSKPIDNEVAKEIEEKFNAFKSWAVKQIENL